MAVKKVHTEPEPNTNVLKGIACPSCGYTDSFDIECSGVCEVTDDGVDTVDAAQWVEISFIRCGRCGHEGTVAEFEAKEGFFSGEITVKDIDLDLLKAQKVALIDAMGDDDDLLDGLLNLVDHIQDQIYYVRGHEVEESDFDDESDQVTCKFCSKLTAADTAHLHQGEWICDNCWDDRLRSTE